LKFETVKERGEVNRNRKKGKGEWKRKTRKIRTKKTGRADRGRGKRHIETTRIGTVYVYGCQSAPLHFPPYILCDLFHRKKKQSPNFL